MIYFCIPAHNEARTVGVLLWKLREVMNDLSPDYRILVLDDASTDATREVLEPYARVLPLTVIRNERRKGYANALETMLTKAAERTDYPRRDAAVVLQADFTDEPEQVPALVKRIESGADLVIGAIHRNGSNGGEAREGAPIRWLRRIAGRVLRRVDWPEPVSDPLSGFRAYRLVCVKKALAARNGRPLIRRKGWAANVELLHTLIPYARRVEEVPVHFERERRGRGTRLRLRDLLGQLKALLHLRAPREPAPVVGGKLQGRRGSKRRSSDSGKNRGKRGKSGRGATSMVLLTLLAGMFAAVPARAQNGGYDPGETPAIHPVPFGLGERMVYKVELSPFGDVGRGSMEVVDLDTVRGRPTYHLRFDLEASVLLFASVDDRMESWVDISRLFSLRFEQDQDELTYERHRVLQFHASEGKWVRSDVDPNTSGPLATNKPLDDVSFLYYARTLPLDVGDTYTLHRYWKEDGNPVVLKVLGKETVTVPAGRFNTIVVQPIIQTDGLFGKGGEAKVYFTDDVNRTLVKMEANVPVLGSLRLHLISYSPGIKVSPLTFRTAAAAIR